ncbi:MAG: cadherin repeat domain-containing protein, partial [Pseudomonadota bacterium]|nr:cadherin repeat domain-containing protein [Pseudomonadota bacterium]
TVEGEDPDGDTLTFSVSGGEDGSLFQIDSSTGELSFIEKPDYEDPKDADQDNIYSVEVSVDDGNGNTASQTILVTVNNVQSRMTLSSQAVDENDEGAKIGTLDTFFDDALPSGIITYSISGTGSEKFEVIDGELKIKDGVQLNFESNNDFSLTINASNQNGTSTSFQFTITVNDVNDLPSNIELAADSLQGDLNGAIIGEITVSDEDAGETFTYAIDDDRFEIIDGVLRLKSDQNISSVNASIDILITVTDSQGGEYQKTFSIIVGGIKLDNYNLNENSDGSIVGKITEVRGIDDAGITYSLSGEDARYFELSNDGTLKLKDGIELDFERDNDYQVLITATNSSGESLKSIINIELNDVDEPIESATYIFGRNGGQLST